jgi:CBS-domain-containing membrane protein
MMVGFYSNVTLLIPPIAASCVIIFTSPHSVFSKTKNILFGHIISSTIAIVILNLLSNTVLSYAIALSLSLFFMLITDTLHPPAGATAILIITTNAKWYYILFPVGIGAIILCGVSIMYRHLYKMVKYENRL